MSLPYTPPRQYQREACGFVERHDGRALLALDMGLGKTLVSLLRARRRDDLRPAVFVVPASLKWNWAEEAKRLFGLRLEVLSGRKAPEPGLVNRRSMYVINYDVLGAWLPFFATIQPQYVVADEAQYLVNRNARRTKWFKALARMAESVVLLSGTPITNRPADLWSLLNILWPKDFASFTAYGERYCQPELTPWGIKYNGAANLEELHTLLTEKGMLRIRKEDVLDQLPSKNRVVIQMEMEGRKEYDHAVRDFLSWLSKQSLSKAKKAKKSQKLVKMGYLRRLAAQLKMPNVDRWVDDFLDSVDDKLILFGLHHAVLHPLFERLRKRGAVLVDGSVKGRDRHLATKTFLDKKTCRVLVGNITAAGVGWNGRGVAHTAFLEFPWAPGSLTQAEDRTHGLGRGVEGLPSNYYYLTARNSVEDKLLHILQEKQGIVDQVLDGKEGVTGLNVHDQLAMELLYEAKRENKARTKK